MSGSGKGVSGMVRISRNGSGAGTFPDTQELSWLRPLALTLKSVCRPLIERVSVTGGSGFDYPELSMRVSGRGNDMERDHCPISASRRKKSGNLELWTGHGMKLGVSMNSPTKGRVQ